MKAFLVTILGYGFLCANSYSEVEYSAYKNYSSYTSFTFSDFNYMSVGGFFGLDKMGIVSFGHRKHFKKSAFDISAGTGASLGVRQVNISLSALQYISNSKWYFGASCDVYFATFHEKVNDNIIFPCPNLLLGREYEQFFHQIKATWIGASYSVGIKF